MNILFYKLLNPVQATIGNIVYSKRDKNELWNQFLALDVFSFFFATYIALGFWMFYQPFITLWLGSQYLLSDSFVALFSVTIYLGAVWEIVYKYRCVFGEYKRDRGFMLVAAIVSVVVSVPATKMYGVLGVQIGLFVAFLPIGLGRIWFVVQNYFEQSMGKYLFKHTLLLLLAIVEGIICYILAGNATVTLCGLLWRIMVWFLVPTCMNLLLFYKNPHFKQMAGYLQNALNIVSVKVRGKVRRNK